jgi:hypothetical protein
MPKKTPTIEEIESMLESIVFMENNDALCLSPQAAAFFLDMKPDSLYTLRKRNIIPRTDGRGRVPFLSTLRGYIRALRPSGRGHKLGGAQPEADDVQQGGPEKEETTRAQIKLELDREGLRKIKRENDQADGLLIPAEEFRAALESIIAIVKPVIETLHLSALKACPEIPPASLEAMQREIARAVNAMVEHIERIKSEDD